MQFVTMVISVLGLALAIFGASAKYFEMENDKRGELMRFWASAGFWLLVLVALGNSVLGIYTFLAKSGGPARSEVVMLIMHAFNFVTWGSIGMATVALRRKGGGDPNEGARDKAGSTN